MKSLRVGSRCGALLRKEIKHSRALDLKLIIAGLVGIDQVVGDCGHTVPGQ